MSTAIVWHRRDLRVHDLPALAEAVGEHDRLACLYVLDPRLLGGRFRSANRTQYLLDCLAALDGELRERGGRLVVRIGAPEAEVPRAAAETGARVVLCTGDASGFARARDARVARALARDGVELRVRPGTFIADVDRLATAAGAPFTVYSPFRRAWSAQERRPVHRSPAAVPAPPRLRAGRIPSLAELGFDGPAPALEDRPAPGEVAAKRAARAWIAARLATYHQRRDVLAEPTSRLSQYLHFGCLSPLWLEQRALAHGGKGAAAYRGELAWRDFFGHVLLHFPGNARREFQARYRGTLRWSDDAGALAAWREGRTGYPVVDAAMRQLRACGWMHNRARLIAGSFLTKDLHLDWRHGERTFMEHLIDGDMGSNNGGWQWIASTGTDPAPYFRRMYNPMLQQQRHDPDGEYVRRWVPELARVPAALLVRPWEMSAIEQEAYGCVIGRDYPAPVVDHAAERREAIERYRAVAESASG